MTDFVFKTRNFVINNEEFCIKNEELCIKNDEFWEGGAAADTPPRGVAGRGGDGVRRGRAGLEAQREGP